MWQFLQFVTTFLSFLIGLLRMKIPVPTPESLRATARWRVGRGRRTVRVRRRFLARRGGCDSRGRAGARDVGSALI
jgi:hypothetical protein